jgi:hypothetical protein
LRLVRVVAFEGAFLDVLIAMSRGMHDGRMNHGVLLGAPRRLMRHKLIKASGPEVKRQRGLAPYFGGGRRESWEA